MSAESANLKCFLYRIVLAPASQSSCDLEIQSNFALFVGYFWKPLLYGHTQIDFTKKEDPKLFNHSMQYNSSGITQNYFHEPAPIQASLVAQTVKNLPEIQETRFDPWVRKIPWRREWQPTPVFLFGEFHRQRSLAGYNPGISNKSIAQSFNALAF